MSPTFIPVVSGNLLVRLMCFGGNGTKSSSLRFSSIQCRKAGYWALARSANMKARLSLIHELWPAEPVVVFRQETRNFGWTFASSEDANNVTIINTSVRIAYFIESSCTEFAPRGNLELLYTIHYINIFVKFSLVRQFRMLL